METERRIQVLKLAAEADVWPTTAERAIRLGVSAIRGRAVRDRLAFAMRRLGIETDQKGKSTGTEG